MSREINMYNPSSPGACWVMECQECFGAVLITWILDYPLINRLVAAKTIQSLKDCLCFCDDLSSHNGNYMGPPTSALFAGLSVWMGLRDHIYKSSVPLAFTTEVEPTCDRVYEFQWLVCSLHANVSWTLNLAWGCNCLHADEPVSNMLNANLQLPKG